MRPNSQETRLGSGRSLNMRIPRYLFNTACLCGYRWRSSLVICGSTAVSIYIPAALKTLMRSDIVYGRFMPIGERVRGEVLLAQRGALLLGSLDRISDGLRPGQQYEAIVGKHGPCRSQRLNRILRVPERLQEQNAVAQARVGQRIDGQVYSCLLFTDHQGASRTMAASPRFYT